MLVLFICYKKLGDTFSLVAVYALFFMKLFFVRMVEYYFNCAFIQSLSTNYQLQLSTLLVQAMYTIIMQVLAFLKMHNKQKNLEITL